MDGESEGLRRQVARLELTIQAEMEKGKVLQVSPACPAASACSLRRVVHVRFGQARQCTGHQLPRPGSHHVPISCTTSCRQAQLSPVCPMVLL